MEQLRTFHHSYWHVLSKVKLLVMIMLRMRYGIIYISYGFIPKYQKKKQLIFFPSSSSVLLTGCLLPWLFAVFVRYWYIFFSSSCLFQTNILFITLARILKYHINRSAICKQKIEKKPWREAFREVELKCYKAKLIEFLTKSTSTKRASLWLFHYLLLKLWTSCFFINVWTSCVSIFTLVICC